MSPIAFAEERDAHWEHMGVESVSAAVLAVLEETATRENGGCRR